MENAQGTRAFECEICLENPTEPVATQCGHVFCWTCLYRWLNSGSVGSTSCPVCKNGLTAESVIPLYGRGRERASGAAAGGEAGVPPRPVPRRTEAVPPAGAAAGGGWQVPNLVFVGGFGFFPALVTIILTSRLWPNAGQAPNTPEGRHQLFLERVILATGFVVFAALFLA